MDTKNFEEELKSIEDFLATPDAYSDPEFAGKSRRASILREIISLNTEIANAEKGLEEAKELVNDPELGEIAKDDIVTINYSELGDDGNVIAGTERSDFVFTVGSGENIYKIDDEIIGMKKDESKDITKKYKKDDADPELAGKTASYKVEKSLNVKAIFNSLRNIFTWIPGERILLPEFGSRLRSLLYEGITP